MGPKSQVPSQTHSLDEGARKQDQWLHRESPGSPSCESPLDHHGLWPTGEGLHSVCPGEWLQETEETGTPRQSLSWYN